MQLNTLEESAPETVYELPPSLDLVLMPLTDVDIIQIVDRPKDVLQFLVLYTAVLFAAIFAMNCFIIGTTRLSKIIVSRGRMIIMMQPSILLTCFTLVTCFAGHADAFGFGYSNGLCLEPGTGISGCNSNDVSATVTNFSGPSTCEYSDTVVGNITTRIDVTAQTRYDLGVYIGLDGANALTGIGNACLVKTLGENDVANPLNNGRVGQWEDSPNNDTCLDAKQGDIFGFHIENFEIECKSATGTDGPVTISACFVWDNNQEYNCPMNCKIPNENLQCIFPGTPAVSSAPPHFSDQMICSDSHIFSIFSV